MIITDDFIMLNFPKTGSSFARKSIKKLYSKFNLAIEELLLPNIRDLQSYGKLDYHGVFCQIPQKHSCKKVVSIIRNPIDRILSLYAYGAWKERLPMPCDEITKAFPSFPNLNISEFLKLQDKSVPYRLGVDYKGVDIGVQSIHMIQMFFKKPEEVLKDVLLGRHYGNNFFSNMGEIKFLRQEFLRNDLIAFLSLVGFKKSETEFILTDKVSNATNYDQDKSLFVNNDLMAYIKEKEWLYNKVYSEISSH